MCMIRNFLIIMPKGRLQKKETAMKMTLFKKGGCPKKSNFECKFCQKERSCIYSGKVTRQDTQESETYTGLAGGTFKQRFYGHNASFNNRRNKQTTLSNYVWELKDNNIPFEVNWTILAKARKFNPVTNKCRLCLKEIYYICYRPEIASLNFRS